MFGVGDRGDEVYGERGLLAADLVMVDGRNCIAVPYISCSSIGSSINSSSLSDSEELLYPAAKGSVACAFDAGANIPSYSPFLVDVAGRRRVGRSESLRIVGFEFSIVSYQRFTGFPKR